MKFHVGPLPEGADFTNGDNRWHALTEPAAEARGRSQSWLEHVLASLVHTGLHRFELGRIVGAEQIDVRVALTELS